MEIDKRLDAIAEILQNVDAQQFTLFAQWFNKIVGSTLPKDSQDAMSKILEESAPEEVVSMISNFGEMIREALEEAAVRGKEEGRKLGKEEGIEEGIILGNKQKQIEIAKNLLQTSLSLEQVVQSTGLSLAEVQELAKHNAAPTPK